METHNSREGQLTPVEAAKVRFHNLIHQIKDADPDMEKKLTASLMDSLEVYAQLKVEEERSKMGIAKDAVILPESDSVN